MPLIKNGAFAPDPFTAVGDAGEVLPDGAVLISLTRFLAQREAILARAQPLAVRLETAERPEALAADLERIQALVIRFASFRDGRGFSLARLLRTRLGYRGELRAQGAFLPDQLAHLARVGFDAFDGDGRITPHALAEALREIGPPYQPAPDGALTIRALRPARA